MESIRLFVIWTHPLFQEAVRQILNQPTIEWVGSTSNYALAQDQILRFMPSVVLVEEVEASVNDLALAILEACTWDMRVLGLSLTDNQLSVYHREHRIVGQVEDLLHLVQGK